MTVTSSSWSSLKRGAPPSLLTTRRAVVRNGRRLPTGGVHGLRLRRRRRRDRRLLLRPLRVPRDRRLARHVQEVLQRRAGELQQRRGLRGTIILAVSPWIRGTNVRFCFGCAAARTPEFFSTDTRHTHPPTTASSLGLRSKTRETKAAAPVRVKSVLYLIGVCLADDAARRRRSGPATTAGAARRSSRGPRGTTARRTSSTIPTGSRPTIC